MTIEIYYETNELYNLHAYTTKVLLLAHGKIPHLSVIKSFKYIFSNVLEYTHLRNKIQFTSQRTNFFLTVFFYHFSFPIFVFEHFSQQFEIGLN